jgi:hypothetical protein
MNKLAFEFLLAWPLSIIFILLGTMVSPFFLGCLATLIAYIVIETLKEIDHDEM